ncbi:MAG: RhuM family protein [Candidatus Andersenbacteria bacterium]
METVQKEGKRQVLRSVEHYNLDLVLSIGYRVNSKQRYTKLYSESAEANREKEILT